MEKYKKQLKESSLESKILKDLEFADKMLATYKSGEKRAYWQGAYDVLLDLSGQEKSNEKINKQEYLKRYSVRQEVAELISNKFKIAIADSGYFNDSKIMIYDNKPTLIGSDASRKHSKEIEKYLKTLNKDFYLIIDSEHYDRATINI